MLHKNPLLHKILQVFKWGSYVVKMHTLLLGALSISLIIVISLLKEVGNFILAQFIQFHMCCCQGKLSILMGR
jgi:hypothetical protein